MRRIAFGRPLISEAERLAVLKVLEQPVLTHGPRVADFERAFVAWTGAGAAVATSSCTAAMHLAYMQAGIEAGDEVIVPALTHVATAHAVELCGASCVFCDAEPETGNLDVNQLETLITPRTRAVAVVHYLGMPLDMERVMAVARRHHLLVVEDCALALGAFIGGTHVGLFGDAGCFSFYPVKHITTAEGGMLITEHAETAQHIASLRAFGIDQHDPLKRETPGIYDVGMLGLNYRMNEMSAALGTEQIKLLPKFLERRRRNHEALASGLRDIEDLAMLQAGHGEFQSAHYCMNVILRQPSGTRRDRIRTELHNLGVGTSIYYPRPVPMMRYYQGKYGLHSEAVPVSCRLSRQSIALPVGPHIDSADIEYMIECIKNVVGKVA